jgi:hypothetical protein
MYPPKEERRVSIRSLTHAARRSALEARCAYFCCRRQFYLTVRKEALRRLSTTRVATESRDVKNCVEFRNLHRLGASIVQRLARKADLSHSPLAFTFCLFNARRGVLHVLPT